MDRHADVKGIKRKAEKEKLSWVWGLAREIVTKTLGEGTAAVREHTRGENREMSGEIMREEKIVNMWVEGRMQPLKEERKKPCVFFCSSLSEYLAMSLPKMFLKYGGKLLETENTNKKAGVKKPAGWTVPQSAAEIGLNFSQQVMKTPAGKHRITESPGWNRPLR